MENSGLDIKQMESNLDKANKILQVFKRSKSNDNSNEQHQNN